MDKYIVANWKMNNDFSDIKPFVSYIKKNAKKTKMVMNIMENVKSLKQKLSF